MSMTLPNYENGIRRLLTRLGQEHPDYLEALLYQVRLAENIQRVRLYGDDEARQVDRIQIIHNLNILALRTIGISFNDLCGLNGALSSSNTGSENVSLHTEVTRFQEEISSEHQKLEAFAQIEKSPQEILEIHHRRLVKIEALFDNVGLRNLYQENIINALEASLREIIIGIRNTPEEIVRSSIYTKNELLRHLRDACDQLNTTLDEIENKKRRDYRYLRACQNSLESALENWQENKGQCRKV